MVISELILHKVISESTGVR